jgi:glycine cleavage system H protein
MERGANMDIPDELMYTKTHEWVRVAGDRATVGLTAHAVEELGEIVYLELPEVDRVVAMDEKFCEVESIKTTSEIYAPIAGKVVEVNGALADHPEAINSSPYGDGWIAVIELADRAQIESLLNADGYKALLEAAD